MNGEYVLKPERIAFAYIVAFFIHIFQLILAEAPMTLNSKEGRDEL